MVRDDKEAVLSDPSSRKTALSKGRLAKGVTILDTLQEAAEQLHSGKATIWEPCEIELASTFKCLVVKKGAYVQIIQNDGTWYHQMSERKSERDDLNVHCLKRRNKESTYSRCRKCESTLYTAAWSWIATLGILAAAGVKQSWKLYIGKLNIDRIYPWFFVLLQLALTFDFHQWY